MCARKEREREWMTRVHESEGLRGMREEAGEGTSYARGVSTRG